MVGRIFRKISMQKRMRRHIKLSPTRGRRVYLHGFTVNEVKKYLGKLAKKVRVAGSGVVEVIHTHNGNKSQYKFGRALRALKLSKTINDIKSRKHIKLGKQGHFPKPVS